MRMRENRHDFRQRYRTCVVKVILEDTEHLFYVDDITEDLQVLTGSVVSPSGDNWIPKTFSTEYIDINFNWPRLGTVNINNCVFRLSRIPRQQYRQSYCHSLISWTPITVEINNILKINRLTSSDLQTPKIVNELFYPKYFSVRTAMNDLSVGKKYSVAISNDFYLSLSWNCNGIFLGYKDTVLGKMTSFNLYTPSVNLFKGNEDFIEVVTEQGIRVGGVG